MRARHTQILLVLIAAASFFAARTSAQTPVSPESVVATVAPAPTPAASVSVAPDEKPLPTAAEILQKYGAATGGREVWAGFTTRFMKGLYQTEDASSFASIENFSEAPNKGFSKITLPNGVTVREVCNGKSAWLEDPRGGIHEFTGAALESRLHSANFDKGPDGLLKLSPGRVLGTARVGAHSTYVVEFTPEKKVTSKIYFDTETGFAVRADDTEHRDDGDYSVETYMDDYRPVDGAYFPFRIRHVERGNVFTIRVLQIKNNAPIDESIFIKTDSPQSPQ
jgi:hypothetical protein